MLTVGDDELDVGGDDDALLEAAGWQCMHGRSSIDHMASLGHVMWQAASQLWILGRGRHFFWGCSAEKVHKYIYKHYIHVLLIKTNSMIYNLLHKTWVKVVICVLAAEDNGLDAGGNDDVSSEVAEGVGGFEESEEVTQMLSTKQSMWKVPGIAGDWGSGDPQHLWTRGGILPRFACHIKGLSVTLRCLPDTLMPQDHPHMTIPHGDIAVTLFLCFIDL